ncbi:MAG: nitrite reductase (NAD(P)H) small subunit [Sphingomonadales bacterium]
MSRKFVAIAKLTDIPVKSNKAFKVAGQSILICHTEAGVFAVQNRCSHQASPLEGGIIKGPYLFCPGHAARFDLRDGTTKGKLTTKSIETYEVRVINGAIEVNID